MTDAQLSVVHVVCTDAFAGVERYVTTLSTGLASRGCRVVVIGGSPTRMPAALETEDVRWFPGATTLEAARRLLGRRRTDIVHAHMTAAELAAVGTAPWHRGRVVATRHFAQQRGSSPAARLVGKLVTPRVAAQLAISRFVAAAIEGAATVVKPGTPGQPAGPPARQRRPVVLVAQRLEPEKRTDLALRIWERSGLVADGWRLEIAGGGQEQPRLAALARSLGVDRSCDFLGERDDVDRLQRTSALFLAPRPDEPFGLSVVEAMAAGLPVVAAAGGGHLETVGLHPSAAIYPPDDVDAGGALLRDLAADPARRDRYGAELRALHDQEFSLARQVDATLDAYRSLRSGK